MAAFTSAALVPDPDVIGDLPALLIAIAIGMVVGARRPPSLLGLPTMHLRGVFLAIATLGFAEAVRILVLNQSSGPVAPRDVGAEDPHPGRGLGDLGPGRVLVLADGSVALRPGAGRHP